MANVIISYDLHDARQPDVYQRLNKALTDAGYEKEAVNTVWTKWFLNVNHDQAIEAANGEFERAARRVGHSDFTLEVFASDEAWDRRTD